MKNIYTICYSIEEALALSYFIMGKGYEGVQNSSDRYNKMSIKLAFSDNKRHNRYYCFVGVNGYSLVVGKNKTEMKIDYSTIYIRKPRVFKELLSKP